MEQITKQHPNSGSADLVRDNIEQLAQFFPEVIKEGKVDFEALHDLLGEYGDSAEERFCLNWAGKARARREAQKRSTGTLRPCKEDSVDWDTTENLYIEGDNLEVLKLLQKSYHKQVKMIYIDPPYNTGKDFVYKDNYKDNMANYLELTGQDRKMSTKALSDSDGRYHSNWLNMMYPRLKLARNLLTDDGVIFISIDDNEVDNLKKICNEIFGEENFVADIIWNSTKSVTNTALISVSHTHTIVFFKEKNYFVKNRDEFRLIDNGDGFTNPDNDPRGDWKADPFQVGGWRPNQQYEITNPKTGEVYLPNSGCSWKNDYDKYIELVKDNRIVFGSTGEGGPQRKRFIWEAQERGKVSKTLWDDVETTTNGTQLVKKLFDGVSVFDNPKPVGLLLRILELGTKSDSIILDFFSGSATTAHAVIQQNAGDKGNRKYICVQIPEITPEESEARKAGYETIPEVAKERIRRAGKKIIEEQNAKSEGGLFAEEVSKLDTGFKVFKLDSSNIYSWDSSPENLEQSLNNSLFNIKEDRTEDDLLYEILIKYGVELSVKINRQTIADKTVYEMGAGSLIVCLADNLTKEVAEGIAALYKSVSPEGEHLPCRVVFKESGFNGSDEVKSNTMLILKQHGITNVASV